MPFTRTTLRTFAMEMDSLTLNLLQHYTHVEASHNRIVSQLSSGQRIVRSAIDPSGLAISKGFQSQLRGAFVAVHNAQETMSLISLADKTLGNVTDIVIRIRDLAVRMANEATASTQANANPAVITSSDQRSMFDEMGSLAEEIRRQLGGMLLPNPPFVVAESGVQFNGKDLFFAAYDSGQQAQIGADNASVYRLAVIIPSMTDIADSIPVPAVPFPGNFTSADFRDFANIQLTELDADLEKLSDTRSALGSQFNAIQKIVNDLNIQSINLAQVNSRLSDTDMAAAATELKQNLMTQSTMNTALLHLNDMQSLKLQFLNVLSVNNEDPGTDAE